MLKKLKRLIKRGLRTAKDHKTILVEKGILTVGQNSDINNLEIASHLYDETYPNVIIGEDCQILCKIELQSKNARVIIGNRVYIGPDTKIFCKEKIVIEDDILISWGCTILDTNFHSLDFENRKDDVLDGKKGWTYLKWKEVINKPVIIKSKSWIGFNSIITKGVVLEEGTVVACGSVVTKSTEMFSVVGGNPATIIKKLTAKND